MTAGSPPPDGDTMARRCDQDLAVLVAASVAGDGDAWEALVRRFAGLVTVIVRQFRLRPADAQDVSQLVWLRLVESLPGLREPAALPGWLVTTTRHECQRYVRRAGRSVCVDPGSLTGLATPHDADLDAALLAAERHRVVRAGLAELEPDQRRFLELLSTDPPHSYAEIGRILDLPVGSIGPTRRRVLDKLRATSAVRAYLQDTGLRGAEDTDGRWAACHDRTGTTMTT